MSEHSERPSFSITVEWENARFAELQRTRQMLVALRSQIQALPPSRMPPVLNFMFNRHSIDAGLVQRVVAEDLQPDDLGVEINIVPNDGLRYYEQKNAGAKLADTDITIFLDCDVVPEPGWLQAILAAFDNPAVEAVGGQTYIELDGAYSRAFALFWFFPLRSAEASLLPAATFHANNVAFRSAVFARFPFPDSASFRGQCVLLGQALTRHGVGLYEQQAARVSHPCPLGLWFFTARALHNGRDWVLTEQSQARPVGVKNIYWNLRADLVRTFKRIDRDRHALGMGRLAASGSYALACVYFGFKALGSLISLRHPLLIARRMPI